MLDAARDRVADLPNVELRRGDLEALPIDSASCDAALLILVLSYSPQPSAVLREMSRILKPGAKAVIVDLLQHDRDDFRRQMGQHHLGFDPRQLEQLFCDAALKPAPVRPLPTEPDTKGPAMFLATALK
jgi:ArsR family transcriptional regulator